MVGALLSNICAALLALTVEEDDEADEVTDFDGVDEADAAFPDELLELPDDPVVPDAFFGETKPVFVRVTDALAVGLSPVANTVLLAAIGPIPPDTTTSFDPFGLLVGAGAGAGAPKSLAPPTVCA